jgi:hypothetical protein
MDVEVALTDPSGAIRRLRIVYEVEGDNGKTEEVEFMLESGASATSL